MVMMEGYVVISTRADGELGQQAFSKPLHFLFYQNRRHWQDRQNGQDLRIAYF
jgi:hypothetical protein